MGILKVELWFVNIQFTKVNKNTLKLILYFLSEVLEKNNEKAERKLFADHESKHAVDEKVIEDSFEPLNDKVDSGKNKKSKDKKSKDKSKNKKKAYEKNNKDKYSKKSKDNKKNKDKKNKNKDKKKYH